MRLLIILLLTLTTLQDPSCPPFSNSRCDFSFAGHACRFSACRTPADAQNPENGTQAAYYRWQECISECCPAGTGWEGGEGMDYLMDKCGGVKEESLLAVILGFSIGMPLFILLLLCLYCKPWNCLKAHPSETLADTSSNGTNQKIKSAALESFSFAYQEKRSDSVLNFQDGCREDKSGIVCSICLEDSVNLETQCGHHFHLDCLAEWLVRTPTCPDCRFSPLSRFSLLCGRCCRNQPAATLSAASTCKWCRILPN